ncbi:MAG: DUF917 domain-containing protein [Gammaproteobacteria bacterium]|nr:DUF917 domain-containing protein [Gammaproteobacteria bacterium]NNL51731.1 DUF917 domain-containing protein [Woeseiaceae bacterium]
MQRRQFMAGLGVALGTGVTGLAVTPNGNAKMARRAATGRGVELTSLHLEDTLLGSSYLGCGGGGGLGAARELIASDLAAGLSYRQLSVSDLSDDEMVASPYALESLAPVDEQMQARLDQISAPTEMPTISSFRLLEDYLGINFSAVIIGEIGPESMAEGLSLGARIGIPSLDADTVGRATPEINQHSVRVAGHAITPAAAVTQFGDQVILKHVEDPSREEDVFRALSVVSRLVGVTDAAISGAVAKSEHVLVQGSLSLAANIGRAVREASAAGRDPIDAARSAGDGYRLFEGVVRTYDWVDRDGFLVGDVTIDGSGAFKDQSLVLDYKNEHLVAKKGGVVLATCPDLITMVDRETNEGIGNPDFEKGQSVVVLAFRAAALWRRPEGLAVFQPRYFGYDVDYVPVEDRLQTLSR